MTVLAFLVALGVATGFAQQAQADPASGMELSEADRAAVFKAACAARKQDIWVICADDPNPTGATIETVRDLNGDGRPEAVVTEGGTYCYGFTGIAFQLLGKQASGRWRVMSRNNGIPEFLKTKGEDGWPDISVGGPGFCFPVHRCKPPR